MTNLSFIQIKKSRIKIESFTESRRSWKMIEFPSSGFTHLLHWTTSISSITPFNILYWSAIISTVTLFNIDDTQTILQYSIPQHNTSFGYTVTLLDQQKLIVGAPKYRTNGVETGGERGRGPGLVQA